MAPSDGRRVYALIEADSGGLFRSDDGGDAWTRISASRTVRQRAWYYSTITVHPTNPDEAWFPQVPMVKTIDGGKTLTFAEGIPHGDHHDIWFDPTNPKRRIVANDGGMAISLDGGESWKRAEVPIGQCYHVSADNRKPYHVACALQDFGTVQGPSNSLKGRGGIESGDWHNVGGGEAGHIVSKADDPDIVFAGEYLGIMTRYDHRTGQSRNVTAYPENPSGHGAADAKYRFQWTAPIAPSPHDPNVIYHAANVLFRTDDGGQSWRAISPDLTRNDTTKQRWAGGPITGDNTGVEFYGTIFAVAESPLEKGLIWAGSDDGLVQVTRDGGGSWTNVTPQMPGFPEWGHGQHHRALAPPGAARPTWWSTTTAWTAYAALSLFPDHRLRTELEAARRRPRARRLPPRGARRPGPRGAALSRHRARRDARPTTAPAGSRSGSTFRRSPCTI
ncbi:MAG: hypothetical protein R2909_21430 [Gemmatimonadales bacterium]